MAFLGFFKKKVQSPTDEDRVLSGVMTSERYKLKRERMQLEHEIDMLRLEAQKMRLEQHLDDLYGADEDGGIDGMFENLIMNALAKKGFPMNNDIPPVNVPPSTMPPDESQTYELTEEQIKSEWERIPAAQRPIIKMAQPIQIENYIRNKYPNVGNDTIIRILEFIKKV